MVDLAGHDLTDRLIVLICALLLAATLIGPLSVLRALQLHRPKQWLNKLATKGEKKLNREGRSAGKLVYRGMILLSFLIVLTLFFSISLSLLIGLTPHGFYVEILILALLMPVRALFDRTTPVIKHLRNKKAEQAVKHVQRFGRGARNEWDLHTIIRVSIEYITENFADKIVAPALWYIALGLPAAMLIRLVNELDGLIGHSSKRYIAFGWATAKLDDVLLWLPARISGFLLCLAAFFVPGCNPFKGAWTMLTDARKTRSLNHGYMLAPAAGALKLALAGPRKVEQETVHDPWIGTGTAKATIAHLVRARILYLASVLVFILLIGASLYIKEFIVQAQ